MQPRTAADPGSAGGEADPIAAMLARFGDAGYEPVETPILGPASVFLDFAGEEIRSALYLTSDEAGAELCLRPEYTIPVCGAYLASEEAGRQASFTYCGPVFRSHPSTADRRAAHGETLQAGLESFARPDVAAADAEALALSVEAARSLGMGPARIRVGDAGLLGRILDVLEIPADWQRRIRRGLDKGLPLGAIVTNVPSRSADHSGVMAALTGADRQGARALVEDLLSIAGINTVGGRTPSEIADRFMTQVASKTAGGFGDDRRAILERFLAITGHPDEAVTQLRDFARSSGLDLKAAIDLFEDRANFLAVHDRGDYDLIYQAGFGRNLGYYTGFVFEARAAEGAGDILVSGGRYDRLAQSLGSAKPIAAVGASIWVDRIRAAAGLHR